ncbi:MAG: gluconate 2-dehydrogenase subunit 3 family protein [Bryobacteraceae bacterium]
MKTRRDALRSLAAATSLPVFAQHRHPEPPLQIRQPAGPKYFSAADFQTLTVLVDLILPPTGTPGASAAHVDFYIDSAVAARKSLAEQFREGLAWLEIESNRRHAASFARLTAAQQTAILATASEDLASPPGRFFKTLKDLTIDGYYSAQEGLVQELGWHGNTFLAEFKGCTHPEHQE